MTVRLCPGTQMKIAICGSLTHHLDMRQAQKAVEALGYTTLVPKSLDLIEQLGYKKPETVEERLVAEAKYNFISEHFKKIEKSDAILVVNMKKNGVEGYIGGNTFLEIGIAFYLQKSIYFLNPIPHVGYELELAAMHPIILNGDLSRLGTV